MKDGNGNNGLAETAAPHWRAKQQRIKILDKVAALADGNRAVDSSDPVNMGLANKVLKKHVSYVESSKDGSPKALNDEANVTLRAHVNPIFEKDCGEPLDATRSPAGTGNMFDETMTDVGGNVAGNELMIVEEDDLLGDDYKSLHPMEEDTAAENAQDSNAIVVFEKHDGDSEVSASASKPRSVTWLLFSNDVSNESQVPSCITKI
ncbi:hypothetical protein Bca52824_011429 [Brassica carinata]|uniref:Uncharacterized protein n=1 Tax=Brassica carinata TaxID=52824 RepID=A0A8X7WFF6_BRACI|nr:hypothetical protein Bca52824_011429 [Brassica carinata]